MIRPGDPAPTFTAKSDKNPQFRFDTAAGRNLVLTFVESGTRDNAILQKLSSSPLFDDIHAALFIVSAADESSEMLPLRIPGVRAFFDSDRAIEELYGLSHLRSRPVTFVISPRMQVIGLVTSHGEQHAKDVLRVVGGIPSVGDLPSILSHAPVLIIPHVFEMDLCHALIRGYQEKGGRLSGFMRDVEGKTVELQDRDHKIRRDWDIEQDSEPNLITSIQSRIIDRVVPEIRKAFQFHVTRMERYLVSCYAASEGGHFRAHRDNTTRGTAHRRFAVSLNLNTNDYEGGALRFPEFGMNTYRPPTGGCCVFSCSLLHEATPVTKGIRYAFLPFLYDEAARKIREENLQYLEQRS